MIRSKSLSVFFFKERNRRIEQHKRRQELFISLLGSSLLLSSVGERRLKVVVLFVGVHFGELLPKHVVV